MLYPILTNELRIYVQRTVQKRPSMMNTPKRVSGEGPNKNQNLYQAADRFVKSLNDEDYYIDIESKSIELSDAGITKAELYLKHTI